MISFLAMLIEVISENSEQILNLIVVVNRIQILVYSTGAPRTSVLVIQNLSNCFC